MVRVLIGIFCLCSFAIKLSQAQGSLSTTPPWTYWWRMGSAVDSVNLQRQLLAFSNAGFGGVHIIPVYGVRGHESRFKAFLSKEWMNLLNYTTGQAQQLGLGVDLTMGTDWPFGGKQVTTQYAAKKFVVSDTVFGSVPTLRQVKRAAPGGEGL
ncbi:MAG TPA: glycosyl hydrolase [Chryseolinea sp.]|nr:glycosyl hydrolase [Chryseolinea sp.]